MSALVYVMIVTHIDTGCANLARIQLQFCKAALLHFSGLGLSSMPG